MEGTLRAVRRLPSGSFVGTVHSWNEVAADPDETSFGTLTFLRFSPDGEADEVLARGPGMEALLRPRRERMTFILPLFAYRPAAAVSSERVYFGRSRSFEIEVAGLDGRTRAVWRHLGFDPSLSEEDVRRKARDVLERRAPELDPDAYLRNEDIPHGAARPPFSRMIHDPEGYLWVAEFAERDEDARRWLVFDLDGRYLGDVTLPEGFRLLSVGPEELLGRYADPYGVESVWVLRLERAGMPSG